MRKETLILMSSFSLVLLIIGGMLEVGVAQQRPSVITTSYADCREMAAYEGIPSPAGCQLKVKDYTKNGHLLVFIDTRGQQGYLPARSIRHIEAMPALPFNPFRNIYLLAGLLLLVVSLLLWRVRKRSTAPTA